MQYIQNINEFSQQDGSFGRAFGDWIYTNFGEGPLNVTVRAGNQAGDTLINLYFVEEVKDGRSARFQTGPVMRGLLGLEGKTIRVAGKQVRIEQIKMDSGDQESDSDSRYISYFFYIVASVK